MEPHGPEHWHCLLCGLVVDAATMVRRDFLEKNPWAHPLPDCDGSVFCWPSCPPASIDAEGVCVDCGKVASVPPAAPPMSASSALMQLRDDEKQVLLALAKDEGAILGEWKVSGLPSPLDFLEAAQQLHSCGGACIGHVYDQTF